MFRADLLIITFLADNYAYGVANCTRSALFTYTGDHGPIHQRLRFGVATRVPLSSFNFDLSARDLLF